MTRSRRKQKSRDAVADAAVAGDARSKHQPNTRSTTQKFTGRRWTDCIPVWSEFAPSVTEVGLVPDPTMSSFLAIAGLQTYDEQSLVLPGVHTIALLEALFLYQKSVHVARSAESTADNGMKSWSVYQAYHSAYFAAKAVMILTGACFPQPQGRQLLLDLFPVQEKIKVSQFQPTRTVLLTPIRQFEQKLLWQFFARVIHSVRFPSNFAGFTTFLFGINYESVSRPRNRYIYHEDHWPFGDLVNVEPATDFAYLSTYSAGISSIDEEDPRFLIVLGMVIPALLRTMLDQLCEEIPVLRPHVQYMDDAKWVAETGMLRSFFDLREAA